MRKLPNRKRRQWKEESFRQLLGGVAKRNTRKGVLVAKAHVHSQFDTSAASMNKKHHLPVTNKVDRRRIGVMNDKAATCIHT